MTDPMLAAIGVLVVFLWLSFRGDQLRDGLNRMEGLFKDIRKDLDDLDAKLAEHLEAHGYDKEEKE